MLKDEFQNYTTFIFDLDGTLLLQNELFPNAAATLKELKNLNKQILFISNNTTVSVTDYAKIFIDSGFIVDENQFTVSTDVLINEFKDKRGSVFYLMGEKNLLQRLEKAGLKYSEKYDEVELVIVSLDRYYKREKFETAKKCLINGAELFAANIDRSCPTKCGEIIDAGEIIDQLQSECRIKLIKHFVKPSEYFFLSLKKKISSPLSKCLIIGDRLETDIQLGNKFDIDTAQVLTGVNNKKHSTTEKPTYLMNNISDLFVRNLLSSEIDD